MKNKIRVLLADDHYMARIGITTPINHSDDMMIVAEARNGLQALEMFDELEPDVAILDYAMPDITGVEAAKRIISKHPHARLLMLSMYDGEEDIHRAASAGVRGYLTKSVERDELLGAIRAIHRGELYFPAELEAKLRARAKREPLTQREIEIIQMILRGLANKQIAEAIGYSESLVKRHVSRIMEKLGARDRSHAAALALERGTVRLGE